MLGYEETLRALQALLGHDVAVLVSVDTEGRTSAIALFTGHLTRAKADDLSKLEGAAAMFPSGETVGFQVTRDGVMTGSFMIDPRGFQGGDVSPGSARSNAATVSYDVHGVSVVVSPQELAG